MSGLPFEQQFILAVQAAALRRYVVRVLVDRAVPHLCYFFAYLILALLQTAIPVFLPVQSSAYVPVWMVQRDVRGRSCLR